jgi:4'-phosphopantetheinyl transferase
MHFHSAIDVASTIRNPGAVARRPIPAGHVQVFLFPRDAAPRFSLVHALSAEERARAERLPRAHDRLRWMQARGELRSILGSHLGSAPESLELREDDAGKPYLRAPSSESPIAFSVSHRDEYGIVAVTCGAPVGVDLESVRTHAADYHRRLDVVAASDERVWVRLSDSPETAFTRLWSRKQALAKALGTGVLHDVSQLRVLGEMSAHHLLDGKIERGQFRLIDLPAPAGFCAALAVHPNTTHVTVARDPRLAGHTVSTAYPL